MIKSAFIRTSYLDSFHSLVLSRGASPGAFLAAAGLDAFSFGDKNQLLSLERFVHLLDNTAAQLKYPELGLQMAMRQEVEMFGPLTSTLLNTSTLEQALQAMMKNFHLQVSGIQLSLETQAEFTRLSFTTAISEISHSHQYQNYALAAIYHTINTLTARHCPLRGCFFAMPEPKAEFGNYHTGFFNCPIAFNSSSLSLTINADVLKSPLNGMESIMRSKTARIKKLGESEDFIAQVERTMTAMTLAGFHNIEDSAKSLGLTTRTLQRRLKASGSSYHHLRDAVRAKLAKQFIDNTPYRLTDIAMMLGYTQDSSFSRSYRRWYGVAPSHKSK